MPNYDFYERFKGKELRFQQFACAVVSVREGRIFQRFGAGRDGGIDGFYESGNEKIILQAKCINRTGKALLSILRQERKKLSPGSCTRYILVLASNTVDLKNKRAIQELFPEILNTADIITGEDLNGFLELPEYAHIEKAYSELWLSSGNYLETLLEKHLSSGTPIRSRAKIELMLKEQKTFIRTEIFTDALEILEKYHWVVISGDPGSGKTAHACCLAAYYFQEQGFEEPFFVNSIKEIEQLWGSFGKKVIVFDDFWGHTSFSESRLELNSERNMQELFYLLQDRPDLRLIFTTREFILQQGFRLFPGFAEVVDSQKLLLRLNAYTLAQRAQILYRHLDVSDLGYDYVKEIFQKRESFLHCDAYSPRSISFFLKNIPSENQDPETYTQNFLDYVEAPNQYYQSIFTTLSYGAKLICLLLLLSEEEIRIAPELRKEFMALAEASDGKADKELFENYLRELEGVFTEVKESDINDTLVLDFLNHSIRDFMQKYLNDHIETYEKIFAENCLYFNQLIYMISELNLSEDCRQKIVHRLIEEQNLLKYSFVFNPDIDWYYSADALPCEYESHKVWQLFIQCKDSYDPTLYQFLENYCNTLIRKLYSEGLQREEMETVINLIPHMSELGWKTDGPKLLDTYYRNINWADELDWIEYLKPCCPEYFDRFMEEHFGEIQEELPFLILQDLEYFLDEWDGDARIDDLIAKAPSLLEKYKIEYTREFEKAMYWAAERELPSRHSSSFQWSDRQEQQHRLTEQLNYQEITRTAEDLFLPDIDYLPPGKIKAIEREQGKDYRKSYLTRGKFTEENFLLVMEYLNQLPGVPRTEQDFYDGLLLFLTDQWPLSEICQLQILARKLSEKNIFFFSEKEGKQYCTFGEVDLKKIQESGLIERSGKWYHFWNQEIMRRLAIQNIQNMETEQKKYYYQEELLASWASSLESGWASCLIHNDREDFLKYLILPVFSEFLSEAPSRRQNAREIWLMREMQWKLEILGKRDQPMFLTIFYCPLALEFLDFLEESVLGDAYDNMESAVADGLKENKLQQFCRKKDDHFSIHIQDLLDSKAARKLLQEKGCFEAASKILNTMEQYLAEAE